MKRDDRYWFSNKVYGYGSGMPIAWQGWAALLGYIAAMVLGAWLIEWDKEVGLPVGAAIMVLATLGFMALARARTRGGWRWRWGGED